MQGGGRRCNLDPLLRTRPGAFQTCSPILSSAPIRKWQIKSLSLLVNYLVQGVHHIFFLMALVNLCQQKQALDIIHQGWDVFDCKMETQSSVFWPLGSGAWGRMEAGFRAPTSARPLPHSAGEEGAGRGQSVCSKVRGVRMLTHQSHDPVPASKLFLLC